jgi:hypothetical protein
MFWRINIVLLVLFDLPQVSICIEDSMRFLNKMVHEGCTGRYRYTAYIHICMYDTCDIPFISESGQKKKASSSL